MTADGSSLAGLRISVGDGDLEGRLGCLEPSALMQEKTFTNVEPPGDFILVRALCQ